MRAGRDDDGPTRGDGEFVSALADFLGGQAVYGFQQPAPERLMATAGASQGLQMVVSRYFSRGDTVFVEDPTYFLALCMLKVRSFVCCLRVELQGVDPG